MWWTIACSWANKEKKGRIGNVVIMDCNGGNGVITNELVNVRSFTFGRGGR